MFYKYGTANHGSMIMEMNRRAASPDWYTE